MSRDAPPAAGRLPGRARGGPACCRRRAPRGGRLAGGGGGTTAWCEALDLADFNAAAQPPGFAASLDVAPDVLDSLLRQAIGAGYAVTDDAAEAGRSGAAHVALVSVRLTVPGDAPPLPGAGR